MRKIPWASLAADIGFTLCGVLACVNAMPTAYDVSYNFSWIIIIALFFVPLLAALIHITNKAWLIPCLAFAAHIIVFGLLKWSTAVSGAKLIWYSASRLLALDYSFMPMPSPPTPVVDPSTDATVFLVLAAAVFTLVIAVLVIKPKTAIPALLVPIPAFALCFVYTDCRPAVYTIALLVIYIAGVLFGRQLKKNGVRTIGVGRLLFLLILAVGALLAALLPPKSKYDPIPYSQRRDIWDVFGPVSDNLFLRQGNNPKEVDLAASGDRAFNEEKAFSVYSSRMGSYLLRTHSYGLYTGNKWASADDYTGRWESMKALGKSQDGTVESICIRDAYMRDRITPYAFNAKEDVVVEESSVKANGKNAYVWNFIPELFFEPAEITSAEEEYYRFALKQYTMPDGKVKDMLQGIVESQYLQEWVIPVSSASSRAIKIDPDRPYESAQSVARFVRTNYNYTLTPGTVPAGKDFVEYFLTESKQGYCVHFASATTAILQAYGIPARYVVGYRVDVTEAYKWLDVQRFSAHAWTEVYVKGVGWLPVESTAGFAFDTGYYQSYSVGPDNPKPTDQPTETPKPTFDAPIAEETMMPIDKPTPRPTREPGHSSTPGTETRSESTGKWAIPVLSVLAAVVIWQGVGVVIRARRKRLFEQADSKAAVIAMLKYLKSLDRYSGDQPENPDELKLEALYSNHDMKKDQAMLLDLVRYDRQTVKKHRPFLRFILKWVIFRL